MRSPSAAAVFSLFLRRASLRWVGLFGVMFVGLCVVGQRAFARERGASTPPELLAGVGFRDQRGAAVRIERFAGSSLLLNFVFTRCTSVCPTQTRELVKLRQALPSGLRARVAFLSISLDPGYDTAPHLLAFSQQNGADWSFLSASPRATRELLQQLQGAAAAPLLPEPTPSGLPSGHGTALYLFDRFGRLMQRYVGAPIDQARLLADLARVDRVSQALVPGLPPHTREPDPSP